MFLNSFQVRGDFGASASMADTITIQMTTVDDLSSTYTPEESLAVLYQRDATGRRCHKTVKGKARAVWPPNLEEALIAGLEAYSERHRLHMRHRGRFIGRKPTSSYAEFLKGNNNAGAGMSQKEPSAGREHELERRLAEPVRFGQNPKLIPGDSVPILTKFEKQQRLIRETTRRRFKKYVDSNQAHVTGTSTAAEFKPFIESKSTEPNQIASQWPYHGAASTAPTDLAPLSSTAGYRCRSLILPILKNRDWQARICSLAGDDAQVIIDYLDILSHEADTLGAEERRRALSLLCKLAKSSKLFPRCYVLTGIEHSQEPLAGGGFAEVWMGKRGGDMLCLKVARMYSKQESNMFLRAHVRELALWAHLSHKNILPFYGVYLVGATSPRICLVSPWMERGNLRDYLNEFPQKPRIHFISDIVDGLLYLHDLQIVHGDLKAQNILVSDDERALIADFGLSSILATTMPTSGGGTTRFMAPELLIGDGEITERCDIWSFACLCYETLTDMMPFYQYKDRQIFSVMKRKEIPHLPDEEESRNAWGPGGIDDLMWDLLVRCWSYVPHRRPSCKAIQESLKNIEFQDDGSKTTTEIGTGSSFWKDMREKSDNNVDYARVEDILLSISV